MIRIRLAQIDDVPALSALRYAEQPAIHRDRIAAVDAQQHYYVAEVAGQLAGFGVLLLEQPPQWTDRMRTFPLIVDLFVAELYRGCGIGQALIRHMEIVARNAEKSAIFLNVEPDDNPRALQLYQRLGYRPLQDEPYHNTWRFTDSAGGEHIGEEWIVDMQHDLTTGEDAPHGGALSLPSPLPLGDFERAIQADPDVLGAFYFGSLGRGAATRHSDLDIVVVVPDRMTEPYQEKLVPLLELFGAIHWLDRPNAKGFVGPHWNQVDIELVRRTDLDHERGPRYAGATVIKDADDGFLAAFVASCIPDAFVETPASASAAIADAISDLLYQARTNARGSLWDARGNIIEKCISVYELLGRLRGRRTYGWRYAETLLTPDEQALLASAWPVALSQVENRRATLALWAWVTYVWREAERALGAPLELEIDEAGLLGAIERMYT